MSPPIMMVDDDPNSIILTSRVLKNAAIQNPFLTYSYGAEALLYLEKHHDLPIIILLDLALPDIHGIDVLRYIRNHARSEINALCVFILTVSDDQATMVKTIENGASAFLSKNLDLAAFLIAAQGCGVSFDLGDS